MNYYLFIFSFLYSSNKERGAARRWVLELDSDEISKKGEWSVLADVKRRVNNFISKFSLLTASKPIKLWYYNILFKSKIKHIMIIVKSFETPDSWVLVKLAVYILPSVSVLLSTDDATTYRCWMNYTHTYIHTYIHAYIYTYIHSFIFIPII